MSKNSRKRREEERYGSPFGRAVWSVDLNEEARKQEMNQQPKPPHTADVLEAHGLKTIEPGYQLIAKVLREKLDEFNALLALAQKVGLEVEVEGYRGDCTESAIVWFFESSLFGHGSQPKKNILGKQIKVTITRREQL